MSNTSIVLAVFLVVIFVNLFEVDSLTDLVPRRAKRQQQSPCPSGSMILNYNCSDNFTCTNAFGPTASCSNSMCCKPNVTAPVNRQNSASQCNNGGVSLNIACTDNTACANAGGPSATCISSNCCSGPANGNTNNNNNNVNPPPQSSTCSNGGQSMGFSCTNNQTCQSAGGSSASCLNGTCCQTNSNPSPGQSTCPNQGTSFNVPCTSNSTCQQVGGQNAVCLSGNCCSSSGSSSNDDYY